MKEKMEMFMGALLLLAACFFAAGGAKQVTSSQAKPEEVTIVVDAGHGGSDPGKVGVQGTLEKEVNLAIAKKLQEFLGEHSIRAVMTREDENGLYDEQASNKKQDDMRKRCARIDEAAPVFTVSIHQNSYTQESVHGPQVFYYASSKEGQEVARAIQDAMNQELEVDRPRDIKANQTYYLLKKTKSPTVIVECGFLSNREEEAKLVTEEYQEKMAQAIGKGILGYLTDKE